MKVSIRRDKQGELLAVLCDTAMESFDNVQILTDHEGFCEVDKEWVYTCTSPASSSVDVIKFEVFVQNRLEVDSIQFVKRLPQLYKMYPKK